MYIWIVLATFISLIFSYSLSFRSDIREITIEPRAEAAVSKMIMKHEAAIKYIYENTPSVYNNLTQIAYTKGEVTNDKISKYMPYGTKLSSFAYTSAVYCLKMSGKATGYDQGATNCTDPDTYKYLVTFGCVPTKWRSVTPGKFNHDLMGAMSKMGDFGKNLGFAVYVKDYKGLFDGGKNDIGSDMSVFGRGEAGESIPQYIIKQTDGLTGKSFSEICGDKRSSGGCTACLIYITMFGA